MPIQKWSDEIIVAELTDDPQFAEEMAALTQQLGGKGAHVVVNLSAVSFLNSSNISRLLRLRKQMLGLNRRLILCAVNNQVWGVFLVTGLDKIFEFTGDVSTALASIQLAARPRGNG
jgi:anti-anti-sigma factor